MKIALTVAAFILAAVATEGEQLPGGGGPSQRSLSSSSYLGGSGSDTITAVLVRPDGAFYVAGSTGSLDFLNDGPTDRREGIDGFVALISSDGRQVLASAVIGGIGTDSVRGLFLESGSLYLGGATDSADFPTSIDARQRTLRGLVDGFFVELNAEDLSVRHSTLIGGIGLDTVETVVGTGKGFMVIGYSDSPDIFDQASPGVDCSAAGDFFVLHLNPTDRSVENERCVGGSGSEIPLSATFSEKLSLVAVVGYTDSVDFPTKHPLQPDIGTASRSGFLTVIDPANSEIVYSSYLGGAVREEIRAVVASELDSAFFVAGSSLSPDMPGTDGLPPGRKAFVSKILIPPNGRASLKYTRLLSGEGILGGTGALDLALDGNGNLVVVGSTDAVSFPVRYPVQTSYLGLLDGFVTVLDSNSGEIRFSTYLGGTGIDSVNAVAVLEDEIYVGGVTSSLDFPVVAPAQGIPFSGDAFFAKIGIQSRRNTCLFVGNESSGTVTVVDPTRHWAGDVLAEPTAARNILAIATPESVDEVFVLGREVSAVGVGSGAAERGVVSVFSSLTGQPLRRFGSFKFPRDILLNAERDRAFVLVRDGVSIVDSDSGHNETFVMLADTLRGAVASGEKANILADAGRRIVVLNLNTEQVEGDFEVGHGARATDAAAVPNENSVAVVLGNLARVAVVNADSGAKLWDVPVDPAPRSIVMAPNRRLALVGHGQLDRGSISVVDMVLREVTARIPLAFPVADVAVTPDEAFLYVSSELDDGLMVLDLNTLSIASRLGLGVPTGQLAFGKGPSECIFSRPCPGDCSADGRVSIDELITLVSIALGRLDGAACPFPGENGPVSVDYLTRAVLSALEGCGRL